MEFNHFDDQDAPVTEELPEETEPVSEAEPEAESVPKEEPTPEEETQPTLPQPDADGSPRPEYREQARGAGQKKTGHPGVKVVALALVCALLGGLGGGALAASIFSKKLEAMGPPVTMSGSNAAVEQEDGAALHAMQQLASELKTNVGDKSLTPADVYDAYVGSTVGIANESTGTNFFGQVTAMASSGSGFIITEDGYIVTNYHVVEDTNKLTVTLISGDQYEAKVVGYESGNDVALIKIDATGLKPVSIGDSDALQVGETVCAIGNPLGELTNTLTIGGISALDREVNTDGTPISMMQTDCAINEGNSGGPLFDMNGNVVGITTAKYYGTTIEGIGFAIPINDVMRIVADLKEYGYVTGQPYMGVTVIDMDGSTAKLYDLPVGAYVNSVAEDSCAAAAGLQEKDIITALGEYEVENMTDLVASLKNFAAGDTTTLTVFRSGETLTLTITFDEKRPELVEKNLTAAQSGGEPQTENAPETPED